MLSIETLVGAGLALVGVIFAIWLITRWVVNVGGTEIAILERRYVGKELDAGRAFAAEGEVGIQAQYLSPGLHFIPWPFVRVIGKSPFITIDPHELGVVTAADGTPMGSGRIFAEDAAGEHHDNFQAPVAFLRNGGIRGQQLRFLTNGTFKIHPLLFQVTKIAKVVIPAGKIGVVTAADGVALDQGQLLGRRVDGHDNFQRAEVFLRNGGQKGPQIDFLRPGTYNILASMFQVQLAEAVRIAEDGIGIVEAKDGRPMGKNDVVAPTPDVGLHNSFQDGHAFLAQNGQRGPQEAVLRPGTYYVNPYLFTVAMRPLTVVRQGEVGVLISNIGADPSSLAAVDGGAASSEDRRLEQGGRQLHVAPEGYRGIQRTVLGPGKYNINPLAFTVVIMPTTTRSVEWAADGEERGFDPFRVVSHDGFEMQVEVRCQYRILPENAPFVVQKLGSIADLEANVIHPQIDGIFRAQVSKSPAISYQQNRAVEQDAAQAAVRADLASYRVEVVSVMITNIHLPEALMKTTQHEAKQVERRAEGEAARIRVTATAEAERTRQIGESEAGIIQAKGEAQAKAYRDQVSALTAQGVTAVEVMKSITAAGLKITPDIIVTGGNDGGGQGGLVQLMLAKFLQEQGKSADAPR